MEKSEDDFSPFFFARSTASSASLSSFVEIESRFLETMALSQVHFKFKSQVDYDSVAFDGPVVTVGELKALIAERTGMGPASASELVLSDPRTGEEYRGGSALVPNAASVLVRRAPQAVGGGPGGVGNARARRGKGDKAPIGDGPDGVALSAADEKQKVLPAPRQAIARPVPLPRMLRPVGHGGPSRSELVTYADPYAASKRAGKDAAAAAVIAGGGAGNAANDEPEFDADGVPVDPGDGNGDDEQFVDDEDAALQSMLASTGSTWKAEVAEAARLGRGRGRGRGGGGRGAGAGAAAGGFPPRAGAVGAVGAPQLGGVGGGRGVGGRGGRGSGAAPPPHYVCRRCNQTGHFVSDCPTQVCFVLEKRRSLFVEVF